MPYKIKRLIMSDGERYCLIVNKHDQMPVYYPNLFMTAVLRKKRFSTTKMSIAEAHSLHVIVSNELPLLFRK